MRIAVTSRNGRDVDQHFGKAERFLVYEYATSVTEPVAVVTTEKYCSSDPNHTFHDSCFAAITAQLDGCRAVVTEMIGELPKTELEKVGIVPVIATGPIAEALKKAHDTVCAGPCAKEKGGRSCPHH
ncbi:MAG: dinitrogenase iron-molybdenum cofactor biosynthesis protein [Desulfuromonas sp.]|nr:MAG: dinitrogenase iron-molybdenum cofactor biosynthesis protein [Desulfuromonas sp.]